MHLEKFLDYISKEKRYSVHTLTSYKTDLNQFFLFLNNEFSISEPTKVTFKIIRNWISHLLESGLKSVSVNRKISSIKSYFKFIEMSGFSDYNPTLKITSPKTSKRLPVFIEKNNIDNLLDNNFVIISLYVDDRTKLSIEEEFKFLNNSGNIQYVNNIGRKWSLFQQINFNNASQPYYVAMLPSGKVLTEPIQFTSEKNFKNWLDSSIEESKK